jgi:histidine triad (HIT) family protein
LRGWKDRLNQGRTISELPMTAYDAIYDPGNIFAKILRGEIPCHKVYEDADALVFMDVMPQAPGHALVVPKAPSRNVLDADPAVLAKVLPLVQKVAVAAKAAFGADGITVMQFNEPAGGQTVFHLHYHVIPRFEGVPLKPHSGKMEDGAVLSANAAKLKAALS